VGFSEVQVGAGTTVYSSESEKKWFVEGCVARLSEGDTYRESWAKAGVTMEEIEETKRALRAWSGDEDAWYVALQAEVIGRK